MTDFDFFGGVPVPVQINPMQIARAACVVVQLFEIVDATAPGEEEVERLRDYHRTVIGGIYLAVDAIFGKDAERELKDAVSTLYRQRHGSEPPPFVPRVMADSAKTGIFKKHIYGELVWEVPDSPNE